MRAIPDQTDLPVLLPTAPPLKVLMAGDVPAGFTAHVFTPRVLAGITLALALSLYRVRRQRLIAF